MFFKITNQLENQKGYQYYDGLNVLDKPFQREGSCVPGGLYYTTLEHLSDFYNYGVWLRIVTIPEDAEWVQDPEGNKWRTNKIILGEKYPLFNLETIKKFRLKITSYLVDQICQRGLVEILEWWKNSVLELKYTSDAIDYASANGHCQVLEWWEKSNLEFKYSCGAINWASRYGHIKVLEWWKNSGLELKYTDIAIKLASRYGQVEVIEWWEKSGLVE